MSKLIAAGTAALGGTATAVGGSYLLKHGGGGGADTGTTTILNPPKTEGEDNTPKTKEATKTNLTFDSLDAFKNNWKTQSKCVNNSFFPNEISSDDKLASATELKSGTGVPADGTFFKTVQDDSSDPYKSCLIIDWKREEYAQQDGSNKWKGKFTGTGSFVKGNEGFVNFNIAETSSADNGQLEFKGVFYLLGKGSESSDKGEIKYKTEVKDTPKKIGINDLDKYLPDVGKGVTTDKGNYGGFFKSAQHGDRLKNICGTNDCQPKTNSPIVDGIELSWEGSKKADSGAKKLKEGSKDLSGGNNLYSKDTFDLEGKLEDFSGTGSLTSSVVIKP